jgi:hypothetical protein
LVNVAVGRLFDALLAPFASWPPLLTLGLLAALTAVALLLVIRATSDQRAIAEAKRQMFADLLEMRLLSDDLGAMFRAQAGMLRHNVRYLRASFVPVLWTIVPLALVSAQLQAFFGYMPLAVRSSALLTVSLGSSAKPGDVGLRLPDHIHADEPRASFPALHQLVWRIRLDDAEDAVVSVTAGGLEYSKTISARPGTRRRSPLRPGPGLLDQVMYPSERPLPSDGPVASVRVAYDDETVSAFGWRLSWPVVYVVLTIVCALALKRPIGVEL